MAASDPLCLNRPRNKATEEPETPRGGFQRGPALALEHGQLRFALPRPRGGGGGNAHTRTGSRGDPYLRGDVAEVEGVPHGFLAPLVVSGGGQVPAVEAAAAVVGVGSSVIFVHRIVLLEIAGGAVRGAAERLPVELLDDPKRAAAPRIVAQHVGLAAPQLRQPGQPVLGQLGPPGARQGRRTRRRRHGG